MEKICKFFENLDEFVYVADIDTYEIVYMNRKTLDEYGYSSLDEVKGKKCYEVLQKSATPCTICNNAMLEEGRFKEWRYFNPLLNKHLLLKDTMMQDNGRRYRIELALDATTEEVKNGMIREYQNLEEIVNEGLRLALRAPMPDDSINVLLEYIGKELDCERIYIFEKDDRGYDNNTYEWCTSGVEPQIQNLKNLPPDVCESWYHNFSHDKNIMIEYLEDIKDSNRMLYNVLAPQNIHSLAVVPLYDDGKIIGFYGVDNPPARSLEYSTNMLKIMGHFIVSALKRRDLVKELETMGMTDQLTKLGNRFAMDRYISEIRPESSIGAVYCDITGLKRVNDSQGHIAGDNLIIRVSQCLARTFDGYGVFRIGGDELLALCPGISEHDMTALVEKLRTDMPDYNVIMAVGAIWRSSNKESMDRLLSESEKLMYEDKARYYANANIDRRR